MAYLSSVYAADPNKAFLYKLTNDTVENRISVGTNPSGICVSTDQVTVLVTNRDDNTVSVIRNNAKVKDVAVGTQPWSVCQGISREGDPGIPYFVTNYSDGTVTKFYVTAIGSVIDGKTYKVGKGPRGICCDSSGNIYVANYLSNTVSVIGYVTDLVGSAIDVSVSPNEIRADNSGSVYVTCASAGIVTKLNSSRKIADINVGRMPYSLCVDTSNNIWVTNYNSNTVTKINSLGETKTFDVGTSPCAIDVDSNGVIWVYNHDSKNITKLNSDGTNIGTIQLDYNPTAFGDFTGMQAMIVIGNSSNYNPDGSKKIGWDDLDVNLQNIISHMTLPTSIKAVDVSLEGHEAYPNVQTAIDSLLYAKPAIASFTIDPVISQIGSSVTTVDFNWKFEEGTTDYIESVYIRDNSGNTIATPSIEDTSFRYIYPDGQSIDASTSFNLIVKDKAGIIISASASIKFLPKIYWGTSAESSINNSEGILALQNNDYIDINPGDPYDRTFSFDAFGAKYLYFAVPSNLTINDTDFMIGGLFNNNWSVSGVQFTNESGYISEYTIFKLNDIQHADHIEVRIIYGGTSDHT